MASSQFALILKELEPLFKCPLAPDSNGACLINLKSEGVQMQMEENRSGDLIVGARLGVVPASRYRENLFKEALKSNHMDPFSGIFGYGEKSGNVILFLTIDRRAITLEKLTAILPPFLEKAKKWTEALKNGSVPVADESTKSSQPSMFGMIR